MAGRREPFSENDFRRNVLVTVAASLAARGHAYDDVMQGRQFVPLDELRDDVDAAIRLHMQQVGFDWDPAPHAAAAGRDQARTEGPQGRASGARSQTRQRPVWTRRDPPPRDPESHLLAQHEAAMRGNHRSHQTFTRGGYSSGPGIEHSWVQNFRLDDYVDDDFDISRLGFDDDDDDDHDGHNHPSHQQQQQHGPPSRAPNNNSNNSNTRSDSAAINRAYAAATQPASDAPEENFWPRIRERLLDPPADGTAAAAAPPRVVCAICLTSELPMAALDPARFGAAAADIPTTDAETDESCPYEAPVVAACGHLVGATCLRRWDESTRRAGAGAGARGGGGFRCPVCRAAWRHPLCGHDVRPGPTPVARFRDVASLVAAVPEASAEGGEVAARCAECRGGDGGGGGGGGGSAASAALTPQQQQQSGDADEEDMGQRRMLRMMDHILGSGATPSQRWQRWDDTWQW